MAQALIEKQAVSPARSVQSYFDSVAGRWSDNYAPGGIMRGRIERFVAACAASVAPNARVLDFGCGSGELACAMAARGWHVTGCDISNEMLRAAETTLGGDKVSWRAIDSSAKLPFAYESFDLAIASSVFEYISEPATSLSEIHRVLVPEGRVLLTVPDMRHPVRIAEEKRRHSLHGKLFRWVRGFLMRGEELDYLPYSISRPAPEEWLEQLRACAFTPHPLADCTDPLLLLEGTKSDKCP